MLDFSSVVFSVLSPYPCPWKRTSADWSRYFASPMQFTGVKLTVLNHLRELSALTPTRKHHPLNLILSWSTDWLLSIGKDGVANTLSIDGTEVLISEIVYLHYSQIAIQSFTVTGQTCW